MKEAADRAKEERCDALREQTAACNFRCMDRFEPDDPRADNCANRCDARLQASGCL